MPDALLEGLFSLGGDALFSGTADALLGAGAETALGAGVDAGLGSAASLGAAGLPFAAGAGELGSVATGLGPAGVSAFTDPAAIASALGAGGGLIGTELAGTGLPAAAGIGEIGSTAGGGGIGAGIALPGAMSAVDSLPGMMTSNASLNLSPSSAGGVTSVGPTTAGTPSGSFNMGAFDTAGVAPAAPGPAAAPAGVAGATDLTSGATGTAANAPSFLDKIVKGAGDQITKSPLTTLAGLGGAGLLGFNMLNNKSSGVPPVGASATNLSNTASKISPESDTLRSYLTSGTLPAGLKTSLDSATRDAKTTAISNAAKAGLPTDPTKNTALAAQLEAIDRQSAITTAEIGKQLFTSGLDETKLSSDLYKTLAGIGATDEKKTQDALAAFAKALGGMGGGGGGLNLKLA